MPDFVTPNIHALEGLVHTAWPEVSSITRMGLASWLAWRELVIRATWPLPLVHIVEGKTSPALDYGLVADRVLVQPTVVYLRRHELTVDEVAAGLTSVTDFVQARVQVLIDAALASSLPLIEYPTTDCTAASEPNRALLQIRDDLFAATIHFDLLVGDPTF